MFQNLKELYGHKLAARDGDIGHVKDFYFDDKTWLIRYLVADTGTWLLGRLVLVSPHAFGKLDKKKKTLHVNLHKKQIENCPSIESHKPVSRQYEVEYCRYYGWPVYWEGGAMWGLGAYPILFPLSKEEMEAKQVPVHHREDKHLQSTHAVTGFEIESSDGTIGHVTGFLMDSTNWAIRELVVETGHWYAGKEILISPKNVQQISYEKSKFFVNLSKADIEHTVENEVAKVGA